MNRTVNHHFGILYCFWVNGFCSPLPPFGQKDCVGDAGRLSAGDTVAQGLHPVLVTALEAQLLAPSPKF